MSAPCEFTTTVSHVSRNFRPLCPRPCACNFILKKARPLRRGDLEATVFMLPCSSPLQFPVTCPRGQLFPPSNYFRLCVSQHSQRLCLVLSFFKPRSRFG